jgi:hypothetical protein
MCVCSDHLSLVEQRGQARKLDSHSKGIYEMYIYLRVANAMTVEQNSSWFYSKKNTLANTLGVHATYTVGRAKVFHFFQPQKKNV